MADFREKLQLNWQAWQFRIASLFFLLGVFVFAVGLGLLVFKDSSSDSGVKVLSSKDDLNESQEVVVDIGGEVNNPGVYRLNAEKRVNDAILAAGGLTSDADTSKMNLAAKVSDGQKVYVPAKQEQVISDPSTTLRQNSGQALRTSQGEVISQQNSSLISINNASEAELDKLPGIGPVTAGKIIGARPYSGIDELLSKKAVTKSVFEKIKGLVSL